MKRMISLLLAMILTIGMVPVQAFADEVVEPVVVETEPVIVETEPVVVETEPVAEETEPVIIETEPVIAETEPVVAETEPVAVEEPEADAEEEIEEISEEAAAKIAELAEAFANAKTGDAALGTNSNEDAIAQIGVGDAGGYENEYNDSPRTANIIYDDYTVMGTVSKYDIDYYVIKVPYQSAMSVTMIGSYRSTMIGLIASDGETVLAAAADMGYSDGSYGDYMNVTVSAGTYYLAVLNDSYTDNYTFYINISPLPKTPYQVTNIVQGVRLRWNSVPGVSRYMVLRSTTVDGEYNEIATTTATTYADTAARSGRTYYYIIAALDTDDDYYHWHTGHYRGTTFVATPDITLRVNRARGVGLGWDYIPGATGYAIYRKEYYGNDTWKRIATITNPDRTTWDDTSVKDKNGEVYRYTVRALAGSNRNILSGCRNTGRTMVRLKSITLNSCRREGAGECYVRWSTTSKATGYEVRWINMTTGDIWMKTIGDNGISEGTYWGMDPGYDYKVQVRVYRKVSGVGSFYSAWSEPEYV